MKKYFYFLTVFIASILSFTNCDKEPLFLDAPQLTLVELNIPEDAAKPADVTIQIKGGQPPYTIWPNGEYFKQEIIDEANNIIKITGFYPTTQPCHIITVLDNQYLSDTLGFAYPIPDVKAIGLLKGADGQISEIEYKFENFGTEDNPYYFLAENVYSNIYSYTVNGVHPEVDGIIEYPGPFRNQKEYSVYNCAQAFALSLDAINDPNSQFYNDKPIPLDKKRINGICPQNWHIPTTEEWTNLFIKMGFAVNSTPNYNQGGYVEVRYLFGEELLKFMNDFHTGYTMETFPAGRSQIGLGWWNTSMNFEGSQFVFALRPAFGFATIHAFGGPGNTGERPAYHHVRCVFNFQ